MSVHKFFVRSSIAALIAASTLLGTQSAGAADSSDYPQKPIRIIVPFAAGGGVDLTARVIGEHLARKFGQPVVIDNKPGAGGLIAIRQTIASPADGYTFYLSRTTTPRFIG